MAGLQIALVCSSMAAIASCLEAKEFPLNLAKTEIRRSLHNKAQTCLLYASNLPVAIRQLPSAICVR